MKQIVEVLARVWSKIVRFVLLITTPFRWVWRKLMDLFHAVWDPILGALRRLFAAIDEKVSVFIHWVADLARRLFKTGKTGERVREPRIGANGVFVLAAISLGLFWYYIPIPRWLDYGPTRFVTMGFVAWAVLLVAWMSQCRADRKGRFAHFVQRAYRPTGLRRVDQFGLFLAAVMLLLVTRQGQLAPFAVACALAFIALLIVEHTFRPEFAPARAPVFPSASSSGPDAERQGQAEQPGEGDVVHTLHWQTFAHGRFDDHEATVLIRRDDLNRAREQNPGSGERDADLLDWVMAGDTPDIVSLAQQIHEICFRHAYSLYATVSCFVAACQSIPYVSDRDSTGKDEYWKYPIETLADDAGDCEDSAVLLAALLRRAGFRSVLLVYPGHAAVGVEVSHDTPGAYLELDDVRYYYCETTDDGWVVGAAPPEFESENAMVVPVPEWARA